jgi:4-amino-4-deoxy-L-arabinose transferase-like glycosyltransferase
VSWKAFFFGSLDPGSFITVDKLPASLWVQALSARLFGFSSWSILLPQAIAGVASILILYRLVRRWQGDVAGLLAALALTLTPVAVVMFRFNNPDALLTFLLLAAAWALSSALEKGSLWRLVGCGVLVGFAFLTKMLEALVILPAFAMVYLVCGPPKLGRRLLHVLAAGAALVVSSGWWVVIVQLWPSASRPYIGGTLDNSVLGLVFSRTAGYVGSSTGSPDVGGPAGLPNFGGGPGWLRVFNTQLGGQISWLVPLALVGLVAGLWMTRRAPGLCSIWRYSAWQRGCCTPTTLWSWLPP